jgi:hypothetical protein
MLHLPRSLVFAGCCLSLSGCTALLDMIVRQDSNECPQIIADGSEIFHHPLTSIRIWKTSLGNAGYRHPVWAFGVRPGSGLRTGPFRYGEVPAGFEESDPAQILEPGERYSVHAVGAGWSSATDFVAGPKQCPSRGAKPIE